MMRSADRGLIALALAVGLAIRMWQLGDQVLVDDEWHALHKLTQAGSSYVSIITDFGATDHSIPLTLLYRGIADTIGLSELRMRLPSLLAGLLILVAVPAVVARPFGPGVAVATTWLLALSPLHIFFSRLARPYALLVLCGGAGLGYCFLWWRTGSRRCRDAFVACAVFGMWAHLSCAPFFAAAALYGLASKAVRATVVRVPTASLVRTFLFIAIVEVALLLPAAASGVAIGDKLGSNVVAPATLWGAAQLWTGTSNGVLVAAMLSLAVAGAALRAGGAASRPDGTTSQGRGVAWRAPAATSARFFAACVVAQAIAIALFRPSAVDFPIVFARYCGVALVPLLVLVAVGLERCSAALRARVPRVPPYAATIVALALLVALGPLRRIYYYPNNFTNHAAFEADYRAGGYFERFRPLTIPAFYDDLRRHRRGSLRIVEAPWHFFWHSYPYYQRIHRQQVFIGGIDRAVAGVRSGELPLDRRFAGFQRIVNVGDYPALARRDIDYVIFHKAVEYEMRMPFPHDETASAVSAWITEYAHLFGTPVYDDETITVFDVRDLQRRMASPTL